MRMVDRATTACQPTDSRYLLPLGSQHWLTKQPAYKVCRAPAMWSSNRAKRSIFSEPGHVVSACLEDGQQELIHLVRRPPKLVPAEAAQQLQVWPRVREALLCKGSAIQGRVTHNMTCILTRMWLERATVLDNYIAGSNSC